MTILLEILAIAIVAILVARLAAEPWRGRGLNALKGWVTSLFGPRQDTGTGEPEMHTGVDIAAPFGAEVRASAPGHVLFAGDRGRYGQSVVVDHGRGLTTHYAHLSEVLVKSGESIALGRPLGKVGNTGLSSGPHLHWEVRQNGLPVDPLPYLDRMGR